MMVWVAGVPAPMIIAGAFWVFSDITGLFDQSSGIANLAHLVGMATGLIYGLVSRIRMPRRPRPIQIRINENDMRNWEDYYLKDR